MAATITNIDPVTLKTQTYSFQDLNLVPAESVPSQFDPSKNYIEYIIQSLDGVFSITEQNYGGYKVINDTSPVGEPVIYDIDINPEQDVIDRGFSQGSWNTIYNFLNNELSSSSETQPYYIKEISSDRTEIRIASNVISNSDVEFLVNDFLNKLTSTEYFQDFYLNFGSNNLIIANNLLLDNTKEQYEVLINLYEPLPTQFTNKNTLWVVTKVADSLAFNITFQPTLVVPQSFSPTIKGPNFDLPLKDQLNNSSFYVNYEQLLTTEVNASYQQMLSYLNDKSINIGINFTDFSNFVHLSSAETRINRFFYKIQLLEQYNADLGSLSVVTSSSLNSSITVLNEKIDNIFKNFDAFEYYLYYESGSNTYPKSNSIPPYSVVTSTSPQAITWYNEQIISASAYDRNNQDYLVNTIPDYLKDDPQNDPYKVFVDMVGHFYDNIYVYYKDVSNRYNGDNRLEYGISKDLVADALRSFGLKIYQNNFSTDNLFAAFTGVSTDTNLPPGGYIISGNLYVTSSYIVEDADPPTFNGYFEEEYTEFLPNPFELITDAISIGDQYTPTDDLIKEIYKRLYHNLPLLLKQKGTVAGLRNLINIYGIPDTILRISEFGGRDKDETTYDYFYDKYSLAATVSGSSLAYVNTFFELNTTWSAPDDRPACVQFRFNTNQHPSASMAPLGLFQIDTGFIYQRTSSLILTYTGSGYTTASYSYPDSGSKLAPDYQYAKLDFVPNSANPNTSASVYLPFFDQNWWSVMINRSGSTNPTFTLYAGNKVTYNGYDGNQIGFFASSSITSTWSSGSNRFARFFLASSSLGLFPFTSGSIQEIRYWTRTQSAESFKDFIMNPSSIDFVGENEDYANYLAFRAPLGNELYTGSSSVHPKVSGSWPTTASLYDFAIGYIGETNEFTINTSSITFVPTTDSVLFNSPIGGLKNRVTDKIQIVSSSYPPVNLFYTQSGDTLSQYRSIEQFPLSTNSESPDVNALEVAFSPQNEIDDDIISSLGYFNIGEYIGDPRQISSSATSYPDLVRIRDDYFKKYFDNYDLVDYIRLIKFFDNSLFKMIKDFVPARTNLRSGIVIKPHMLERNKYPQPQASWRDEVITASVYTQQVWDPVTQDTYMSSSLIEKIYGSTGGTFNEFNGLDTSPYGINTLGLSNRFFLTQSWYETTIGPSGSTQLLHDDQSEFYNGELQGTIIEASNGELNEANVFKHPNTLDIPYYDLTFYISTITSETEFTNPLTSPNQGEMYLWYDSGSIIRDSFSGRK